MQGVIAEYERAKIAERYRRGKLFRVRAGEAIFWKVPYGYRRVPRTAEGPARLEIHEPEAAIVRGIFDEYTAAGRSIARSPAASTSKASRRRPAVRCGPAQRSAGCCATAATWAPLNGSATRRSRRSAGKSHGRQTRRPKEDWVRVPVPAIDHRRRVEAPTCRRLSNSMLSADVQLPRDLACWRGLVNCGKRADVTKAHAQLMRSTAENGTRKNRDAQRDDHDTLRAGGSISAATERWIRADELTLRVRASPRHPAAPRRAARRRTRIRREQRAPTTRP